MKAKKYIVQLILVWLIAACNSDKIQSDNHSEHKDAMSEGNMKPMEKGMDMTKKMDMGHAKKPNIGSILEPVNETVLSTVKTVKPERKTLSIVIDAPGYITYDPTNASSIASRYAGRIDKLYVKYNFQEVKKGQKIMEIYSPELLTAEQNLVFLLNNDSTSKELIQGAKQRIRLLGMTEEQIRNIVQTRKTGYLLSVYSPLSGHIHEMNSISEITMPTMQMNKSNGMNNTVIEQEISIKEGGYIQKGQTVFSVINTSKVWAILKIYPENISKIKLNQSVKIYPENQTDKVYEDKIGFIEPIYEEDSKYLNVRVYLDIGNHNDLKIGSLIKGLINTGSHLGVWIPKTAMLDLGNNTQVVLIKSGTAFKTHKIVTGIISSGQVEILEGVKETDKIAMDAQYLIDSESFVSK